MLFHMLLQHALIFCSFCGLHKPYFFLLLIQIAGPKTVLAKFKIFVIIAAWFKPQVAVKVQPFSVWLQKFDDL